MTDNFDLFEEYIKNSGIPEKKDNIGDKFFVVYLIRRGKDHPNLPAANYTLKNYYIDSIDSYILAKEEIKLISKITGTRAYIGVNVKSKKRSMISVLKKISSALYETESKKPWRMFDQSCNETLDRKDKRWVIDIDTKDDDFIEFIYYIINKCQRKDKIWLISKVPTKDGYHLITRPFNTYEFNDIFNKEYKGPEEVPEIKKNHLTLLYEDL